MKQEVAVKHFVFLRVVETRCAAIACFRKLSTSYVAQAVGRLVVVSPLLVMSCVEAP